MSLWRLALASLRHFWRTNLALGFGIAIGTAVLTGALIVGDSIRGSLLSLTVERLGRIDTILVGEHFFRRQLAEEFRSDVKDQLSEHFTDILPAILINQATVETDTNDRTARVQGVTIVASTKAFSDLAGTGEDIHSPEPGQIVINEPLASELGVGVGDAVLLRVGKAASIAADSPLARKSDLVKTIVDLTVSQILPARGLGRFSLKASQQIPATAFVHLQTMQEGLDQAEKINALIVAGKQPNVAAAEETTQQLARLLQPTIADLGLKLNRIRLTYEQDGEPQEVLAYDTLTNERMLFDPSHDGLVNQALKDWQAQPSYTFVATKIQRLDDSDQLTGRIVPYSTITGIDSNTELGPVLANDGPVELAGDEIVINDWTADVLEARVGDRLQVTYFDPETTHGEVVEYSEVFRLKNIVPITMPVERFNRFRDAVFDEPPTYANDPHLTPQVKGITDAESIEKWDAPFPMDRSLVKGRDDDYWANFRATPKAFISVSAARQLWGSRFGETTAYRVPRRDESLEARRQELSSRLGQHYESFGMHWIHAKREGLAASKGTTPFDVLFFGFSQFIIAAALILVALLLRLSLEQRAAQLGLVGAVGFNQKRVFHVMLAENGLLILLSATVGVALGVAYAWLMLTGLSTLWVEAIVTPFMRLVVTPRSLLVGYLLGTATALATIAFTLRRLRKVPISQLMSGTTDVSAMEVTKSRRWTMLLPWIGFLMALGLGVIAPGLPIEAQGGAFFGAGACVLTSLLLITSGQLRQQGQRNSKGADLNLSRLASRNLTRNPTRSTLTIGLVAAACFLIIAISAFRLSPTEGGTGGFAFIGTSDQPIFDRLDHEDSELPDSVVAFSLRMQDGDDASCRNLYQSSKPRIIGITEAFIAQADNIGEMEWAAVDSSSEDASTSWRVLSEEFDSNSDAIPVVLDKNTAMYGMQIYTGVGTEFERDYGAAGVLKFKIVGLLAGSTFQGNLLIPEYHLLKRFPRVSGYRYFMIAAADQHVATQLEETYSDQGLDLVDSNRLLTELLAVQNTYLSTFQSLGGLGLLLGTLGLAAVQLRNVIQRQGEMALMRAVGLRYEQLSILVLREHILLLFTGLLLGTIAAMVVVIPHMIFGGATVPVISLFVTLGLVAAVGLCSAFFAQRYLQTLPLLSSLRGEGR